MRSEFLARAEIYRAEIVGLARRIIQTPSPSGQEGEIVQLIASEMQAAGFAKEWTDPFGNVIGQVGDGPVKIAIDAHIDTVEPGNRDLWERDPYSGDTDGTWLYGRGASDQKAAMAAMIYGMKIMGELGALDDFTVYVVGSVLEEDCDGLCWRYIIEESGLRPDFVLITEPTEMRVNRGQRGRIEVRLRVAGRSAHASSPELGDNAVYKMARVVAELERLNERLPVRPVLGKGTIAVTEISSQSPSLNAVPDVCEVHLDRRLTVGESKDQVFRELEDALRRAGIAGTVRELVFDEPSYTGLRYPTEKYFPVWLEAEDALITRAAAKTYRRVFGRDPEIAHWNFSTNGTVTAGVYNIPTVGFGPGAEALAHAPNERVKIEDLVFSAAFYAAFPATLLTELAQDSHKKGG